MSCDLIADRALDTHSDEIVALKKMRMENEKDGMLTVLSSMVPTLLVCHGTATICWPKEAIY